MNKKGQIQYGVALLILAIILIIFFSFPNLFQKKGVEFTAKSIESYTFRNSNFEVYIKIENNLEEEIFINKIKINSSYFLTSGNLNDYFPKRIDKLSFIEKRINFRSEYSTQKGVYTIPLILEYQINNKQYEEEQLINIEVR